MAATKPPVVFDKDVCNEVRNKFLALPAAADLSKYYPEDVERIKVDDVYVSRFLSHQREDKKEAAKMIDSVFTWRMENKVRALDYSKDPDHALTCLYYKNYDPEGEAIMWIEPKFFDKNKREEFQKYLIWLVEKREKHAECSRVTVVLALDGVGLTEVDVDFVKYFINLFMYYYPDTMKKLIVYNMHWLLNGIWKMVSLLLTEEAKKRVFFVKNKEIFKHVEEKSVIKVCGGSDDGNFKPK